VGGLVDHEAFVLEALAQNRAEGLLIFDEQQSPVHGSTSVISSTRSGAAGSSMTSFAPPPFVESAWRRPPCASTTILEIESPSPNPLPCLVVKNGAKTSPFGSPGPLSLTVTTIMPPSARCTVTP